ncbi:MAG: DUF120 domain-containing protein [Candidatus Heimdallarchaeaceae archaeon]
MNIFHFATRDLGILIYLSQLGGISSEISISTSEIASCFAISQQTASRSLLSLASRGLIEFSSSPRGSKVQLTAKGENVLHQLRFELERALHPKLNVLTIKGTVFSGLGEGKYYVSHRAYMEGFKSKLGFSPFPGTLNLRIDSSYLDRVDILRGSWPIIIPGFEDEGRRFGEVLCYPVSIPGLSAQVAIIIPRRTHYSVSVLELISDVYLREELKLKDGDKLTIEFSLKKDKA